MEKQKKIALINDLTGFGRCSTAVMAPIVSAMKIQAVAVPTAILSAHTQFPTYYFDDYTDRMKEYIQTYKDLKLDFDAISTGFLGSEQQVDIVLDFIRHFKTDRNFVIVDPVMGDYGKLYRTYTKEMCDKMKELVHYADIITPNLTELCTLLDAPYPENGASIEELKEMCGKLAERGPKHIVVTGIHFNQTQIANFVYNKGEDFQIVMVDRIGGDRSLSLIHIYMLRRADDIGKDNPMASNLYEGRIFLALWDASDRQISVDELRTISEEMMSFPFLKAMGLMINANKKSGMARIAKMMHKDAAWLEARCV